MINQKNITPTQNLLVENEREIFAWAVFDGEGSYDLWLFDGNENFQKDFIARNGKHYIDWVIPLFR